MPALLEALRPYQWVKNLLVFAPLVFARRMFDGVAVLQAAIGFAAFCLVASGIYLLNDLLDIEADRTHPEKKDRPLPSGRLSVGVAWGVLIVLEAVGLAVSGFAEHPFVLPLAVYLGINILYSYRLKHVVIVDTMCVAAGFLLRVHVGGLAIHEPVSGWLTLCTFFVALMLAFCKRRHELALLGEGSMQHRRALEHYSLPFLDQMIAPLGALTVMTYALYTVSPQTVAAFKTDKLVYTVPFVVYGIFRYLYLVHMRAEGGNPTKLLLKDKSMAVNIVLWLTVSVWIIYSGAALA